MKRTTRIGALVLGLALATASTGSAHNWGSLLFKFIDIQPWQFGIGAASGWIRGAGEPKNLFDKQQWGFLMQKHTPTSSFAAAGATITGGPKTAAGLTVLSFDISGYPGVAFDDYGGTTHGYCGAGAPRFNVYSDAAATCFLGCTHGDKTQDPNTGWWTISFTASKPFTSYSGCEGGIIGSIKGIELMIDEGTDVGPGDVIVDNIRVNTSVAGKPDNF
jgi:hypothetical protein